MSYDLVTIVRLAAFPYSSGVIHPWGANVRTTRTAGLVTCALTILGLSAIPVHAAPLPIAVTSIPLAAADGNASEAVIVVYLGRADGSPNTSAEIPGLSADPNSGVELKGSKWSFETLSVPDSYSGKAWTDYSKVQQEDLRGQLRVMQIYAAVNAVSANESRTLYIFRILPKVGFQGSEKTPLQWRSGTYTFRITYKDGKDQGTALGTLTIR